MDQELLVVRDLKVQYALKKRAFERSRRYLRAVDGVSFTVHENETFGIVGESGCGKTTTGKAIARLLRPSAGSVFYRGEDLLARRARRENMALKREIQFIFQDPFSSLDPRFIVGKCIGEPLAVHRVGTAAQRRKRVLELMEEVGLREDQYTRFPHEFSGGQRQRIGVARALALNPSLIICDEPVSALDVSIQAQILNLMRDLQKRYRLSYIFISHDLSVIEHICDRVAVMYLGHVVELADTDELFSNPCHPYTRALMDAIPVADPRRPAMKIALEGDVPSPVDPPPGCCFHTRCRYARPVCKEREPQMRETGPGHWAACHMNGND